MQSETALTIDGEVASPAALSRSNLSSFCDEARIDDVSQVEERRQGKAVRLSALLERVEPNDLATHVTLHASTDNFAASIPLNAARDVGILIYASNVKNWDSGRIRHGLWTGRATVRN
jgi:2-dehydropantoate 2-reductase